MRSYVLSASLLVAIFASSASAQIWPIAIDERTGVVATETSGWGGPVTPMQGGPFLDTLGMKWWYDYDAESGPDVFAGYQKLYMYWKATLSTTAAQIRAAAAAAAAAYPGETIWWAMSNEPNDRYQANQAATDYAAIYLHYHSNLKAGDPNCRILGPGMLNWTFTSTSVYERGREWYNQFRQAWYNNASCRAYSEANYGVSYPPQDGFNFHSYDLRGQAGSRWAAEDWRYCRDQIQVCYASILTYPEVFQKKIWLTEFGALRSATMSENIILTRQLVGWMRQQPFMERWFWFSMHSDRYWVDGTPPRLELLDENAQRTAVGEVARELALLPPQVLVDPVNGHYATDPAVPYLRPGATTAAGIRDAGSDRPRFELVQGSSLAAGEMRGRVVTAGPNRLIRKVVLPFVANYDNSLVRLVVDKIDVAGVSTPVWTQDVYGSSSGVQELVFAKADQVQSLGIGLVVAQPFTYAGPTAEWFTDLDRLVVYSEPQFAADLDVDGDVDGVDYGAFAACFNGTGNTVAFGCSGADLNGDRYVDGADYGMFVACFNGAVSRPNCSQ